VEVSPVPGCPQVRLVSAPPAAPAQRALGLSEAGPTPPKAALGDAHRPSELFLGEVDPDTHEPRHPAEVRLELHVGPALGPERVVPRAPERVHQVIQLAAAPEAFSPGDTLLLWTINSR
jgi:hypothetical protein